MIAPNKIYLHPDIGDREFIRSWGVRAVTTDAVCYINKDLLMEWLAERKKYYQGLIPAEGAVAFICALDEVKHKIESI